MKMHTGRMTSIQVAASDIIENMQAKIQDKVEIHVTTSTSLHVIQAQNPAYKNCLSLHVQMGG